MSTKEEKYIAVLKEAISQLEEELGNVKTDYGQIIIMSAINERLAELHQLENNK